MLDDLQRVTSGHGVFTVHTGPAVKVLADGRNAHLIQQPPDWWLPKFMSRFDLVVFQAMPQGFWVVVQASQDEAKKFRAPGAGKSGGLLRNALGSVFRS